MDAVLEFHVAINYTAIWLCFEIAGIFIFQKLREPKRRPRYLLGIALLFINVGIMHVNKLMTMMKSGMDVFANQSYNEVNFLIIAFFFPVIVGSSFDYFKQEHPGSILIMRVLLVSAIPVAMMAILNLFFEDIVAALAPLFVLFAFMACIIVPLAMGISLFKASSTTYVKPYRILVAGFIITTISLVINTPVVQPWLAMMIPGDTLDIAGSVSAILVVSGLISVLLGFSFVPPVEDIYWKKDLIAVYIMDKKSTKVIYKKVFHPSSAATPLQGQMSTVTMDQQQEEVLLGGLKGIDDLLSEITSSTGKTLEFIDQGQVKLVIDQDSNLLYLLLSRRFLPVIKWNLYNFKQTFLMYYGDLLHKWIDDPGKFRIVDQLVAKIFSD
jgi:hypothetical protein